MADYWIKLYIEMLDDPKIGTLPDGLCWRFVQCCLMAGRHNLNGAIPDTRQLAWTFRVDTNDLEHEMQQLASVGLVERIVSGWMVKNFAKRQSKMSNAEKQQAYRDRLHSNQYSDDCVTDALPKVTQITDNRLTDNREQITETEKRAPDAFNFLQEAFFSAGIIPAGESDIKEINKMVEIGITPEDIKAGLEWKAKNNRGKPVRYVSQLIGPSNTAMSKRMQSNIQTGTPEIR